MSKTVRVRFFAGAAQAAGTSDREADIEPGATLAELCDILGRGNDRLASVLEVSSFLIDGTIVTDRAADVSGAAGIDVLPPFAGG